ncbi:hypothetical protein [Providencia hangzhouensis]|uniref:hypothetical protein n=1 Tax=Providencia hangzhouensis TaxID=3031799 RepID=UPI0034DD6CDA
MNIPEPTFTPVLETTSNDVVLMDGCISWNRKDERNILTEHYAYRLSKLQSFVLDEKPDYAAISQLLESEITYLKNQAVSQ